MRRFLTISAGVAGLLAAGAARADVFSNVPEASAYTLVYQLAIPNAASFNFANIPYSTDIHGTITSGSFSRIAYYMELQAPQGALSYAYVSMAAFTPDASKIGVPKAGSGAFFQQNVSNMNVVSNVAGVTNGTGITTGNIEFWSFNSSGTNAANVPGASSQLFDWGDQSSGNGNYGSMQIHDHAAGSAHTILSYNDWGGNQGAGNSDVGLGSQGTGQPDWTFAANAGNYTVKNLSVLVQLDAPAPVPEPLSAALLGGGVAALGLLRRRRRG